MRIDIGAGELVEIEDLIAAYKLLEEEEGMVMKTIGGVEYPATAFLVVEDPEQVNTWHLPVRTSDGEPDRPGSA